MSKRIERLRQFTKEVQARDDKDQLGHGSNPRGAAAKSGVRDKAGRKISVWELRVNGKRTSLHETEALANRMAAEHLIGADPKISIRQLFLQPNGQWK
jgi:hypothetical protein